MICLAADQVEKLLKEVGVQANKEDITVMIKSLTGKKLHDLVRDGSKKLASVPSGGAVSSAPAGSAAPAQAAAPAKKEEKKEEPAEEVDMGGLFGDDGY